MAKWYKLHDGVRTPMIDYWEDDKGIRHPIPTPFNLKAIKVVKGDATYLVKPEPIDIFGFSVILLLEVVK